MKLRRIRSNVVFLLLGATVNVAVAWACAAYGVVSNKPLYVHTYDIDDSTFWFVVAEQGPGNAVLVSTRSLHTGWLPSRELRKEIPAFPDWCRLSRQVPASWKDDWEQQVAGWPAYALWSARVQMPTDDAWNPIWIGGIELPRTEPISIDLRVRTLPFRPLWPGFALNTLLYTSFFWLLFAAPFALRRRRRSKRGLCPACAYPIGASEVCTECGAALSPRRGAGM